ncbi:serine acetyltransferase [Pelagibacterales bacterium SAG-MED35]|nr:serine acetyltransferase [Pelagibacterales bacterium SAG-MED35]
MIKHFFIGSGHYGNEIRKWKNFYKNINFSGFVDIKKNKKQKILRNFIKSKILNEYTITIGNPDHRSKVFDTLKKNKFLKNRSVIFKSVNISEGTKVGNGCILMNNVTIANNVKIGKNCHIHGNAVIGHNVEISDNVNIGAGVFIGGFSKIGKNSLIHANSTIMKNIKIGKCVTVGTGSVVIGNLDDNLSVFGVPAKKIFSK